MEHSYEFIKLYPEQIKKDPRYQRNIDSKRIKQITKHWDDDLVNPPKVSLRADGNYYVFNGQHTLAAWKKKYGNRMILCKVYRGLTEQEEKDLFVKQEGFSKAVNKADKLRAEYNSGTEDVVDMVRCAALAGCIIDFETAASNAKNRINAVVTAYNVYKTIGRDGFINVVDILRRSFFGEQSAFNDGFLKGMCYLYKYHSAQFGVSKMVNALSQNAVDYYRQQATKYTGSAAVRHARVFAEQYNKRKKTEKITFTDEQTKEK